VADLKSNNVSGGHVYARVSKYEAGTIPRGPRTVFFSLWASVRVKLVGAALCCAVTACNEPPAVYQFEPAPRAIPMATGASARDPRVLTDPVSSGTVFISNIETSADVSRLLFRVSSDGGDTFEAPSTVSTAAASVYSHGEDAPRIVRGGPIFASWDGEGGVYVARSESSGASFAAPVKVSDGRPDGFSGYASLAAKPKSDAYVVWLDSRDGDTAADTSSVRLARSADQGASFGPSIRVASGVCPCCRPNVEIGAQGEVMVFWRHVFPGPIHDMVVATSHDRGSTFSAPVRIAVDNWKIEGCPDSGIALAQVAGRVYAAWLTEARLDHRGVFLSWSDDSGAHWAPAVSASQGVLDANYPSLSATDEGRVLLVFQGRDPAAGSGWSPTSAFLVEIGANASLSKPFLVPNQGRAVSRPTVVSGTGGRAFIVWTEHAAGSTQVAMERARRR
jgi:hypothetical protein